MFITHIPVLVSANIKTLQIAKMLATCIVASGKRKPDSNVERIINDSLNAVTFISNKF